MTISEEHFFCYIDEDLYVRRQYESAKRIKELVASRCPVTKAPDHLRRRISKALAAERASHVTHSFKEPVYDIQCSKTPYSYSREANPETHLPASDRRRPYQSWLFVSGVLIFISILFWSFTLVTQSSTPSYSVEEYAYQFFSSNNGSFIQPTISTTSMISAEAALAANFNLPIIIPPLTNAEFKGVVYTDFIPDFKIPLLEYYIPQEDQYIYIFVFDMKTLDSNGQISLSQEAVNSCVSPEDFHVREVKGKHIVSWKWNSTWYAAVSNQDGEKLASLVQPLKVNTLR